MRVALCLGVMVFVVVGIGAGPAASAGRAQPPLRDPTKEKQYAAALEDVDPKLGALFREATAALDAGKYPEARAAYEKVLARAPNHAPTLRRLAYAVQATGDPRRAIELARRAREALPGREGDYAVASALAAEGSPASLDQATELAGRLMSNEPEEGEATLAAMIFARTQRIPDLGRAIAVLERLAPDAVGTNYLGAMYYAANDDPKQASAAIDRAEAAGLPAAEAARFREETGINRQRTLRWAASVAGYAFGGWVLGLVLIFLVGKLLSAAALRAIERHAPDRGPALLTATRSLRRAYAIAIGIAAVYYYLSIPFVIAIVLAAVGGVLYGILLLGWIPIKLVLLLVLVGAFTVWALIRSVFVRRAAEPDPGRRLTDAEAPGLWTVLREVAGEVGTRPVDDVFLTPGTEVAVSERGSMTARLRDRGRRFLILGVGVLEGMTVRQLRAVLAHEYGHFSNRDTAGGDAAAAVRAALLTAVIRIASSGGAGVLNPAWHFLRVYFALFQRITLGASRLQEVLADRFAAAAYGGAVFAEGLDHVVRRAVEFSAEADAVVGRARQQRQAIANLYAPPTAGSIDFTKIEQEVAKTMADAGSPYDSHPPVARRIAWVAAFETPQGAPADHPAWTLFSDRARFEVEMTGVVNQRLSEQGVIDLHQPAPWLRKPGTPPPPAAPAPA
jgi:Zn-dependent protease with chaperone function